MAIILYCDWKTSTSRHKEWSRSIICIHLDTFLEHKRLALLVCACTAKQLLEPKSNLLRAGLSLKCCKFWQLKLHSLCCQDNRRNKSVEDVSTVSSLMFPFKAVLSYCCCCCHIYLVNITFIGIWELDFSWGPKIQTSEYWF